MLTSTTALIFLPFVLPICVWVAWSDMKFMKIPNKAVMALGIVFVVLGFILLWPDYKTWLWGLALMGIVLVVGFLANMLRLMGAGDAKFGAVMAPFFVGADIKFVMMLFAACLLGAFVSHRAMKYIPPIRSATTDWLSWTHKDFPMGLALAGTLVFYLAAVILLQGSAFIPVN